MSDETPKSTDRPAAQPLKLLAWGVVIVAFVGFFVGTRARDSDTTGHFWERPVSPQAPAHVEAARSYTELGERAFMANAEHLKALQALSDTARATPTPAGDRSQLASSLARRAERRAYAGAPPTVPHPVTQRGDVDCLACHKQGLRVGALTAPAMSHKLMVNCTQCHVPMRTPIPNATMAFELMSQENTFVGAREQAYGARAWSGAPPTIPHPTHMRDACMSCHGALALPGLATSHPERQSCLQCHAVSASLDLRHAHP